MRTVKTERNRLQRAVRKQRPEPFEGQVRVKVTSQLTVGRSVRLGVLPLLGLKTRC